MGIDNAAEALDAPVPQLDRRAQPAWQEKLPDPRAMLSIFRRNIWILIIGFMAVCIAVAIWYAMQTPIYSATSSVLVQPRGDTVINIKSVTPELSPSTDVVDTEVRLIKSPAIAERVATKFAQKYPDSLESRADLNKLAARLLSTVDVSRVGATYVIEITASATRADQAADIANMFATEIVDTNRDSKLGANVKASEWLSSRITVLERNATNADAALQAYKIRNGLISATGTTLAEQQLANLAQEIASAEADMAEKAGRLAAARTQLRRGGGGADVGAALGSGTIGTLRSREAQMSADVARLESQFGESYPPLETAKKELRDIQQQIQRELGRIFSNLEADVRVSSSRLSSLQASRAQAAGVIAGGNAATVGLSELQRRAEAAQAVYQTFLNRLRETSAQQGLEQADLRVVDAAEAPSLPVTPRLGLTVALALIGGSIVGLAGVGAAEYLRSGLRTKADVERRLRVRYAGTIPSLESTLDTVRVTEPTHDYIVAHPLSLFAESFRSLRAFLMLGKTEAGKSSRSLAIVSPLPREGKSTTAICLARSSAMDGRSTVLIDCDLRRRAASEMLGYRAGPDLYTYLDGDASIDDVLGLDEETGLAIVGISPANEVVRDVLSIEGLQRLIEDLRSRYTVILFDTAPVLGIADVRLVASVVDRVLVITRWNETPIRANTAAIEMLLDAGAKISGVALTQVDLKKNVGGYDDALGYRKKFRGYYVD
jgi:succinoglycan biosynthesis transport protein ExoP